MTPANSADPALMSLASVVRHIDKRVSALEAEAAQDRVASTVLAPSVPTLEAAARGSDSGERPEITWDSWSIIAADGNWKRCGTILRDEHDRLVAWLDADRARLQAALDAAIDLGKARAEEAERKLAEAEAEAPPAISAWSMHEQPCGDWLYVESHARVVNWWAATLKNATQRAEKAEAENTRLRAALAQSELPCVHCSLPKDEWAKCERGFPGCARGDDAMGCPELGAAMERDEWKKRAEKAEADFWKMRGCRDDWESAHQAQLERANYLLSIIDKIGEGVGEGVSVQPGRDDLADRIVARVKSAEAGAAVLRGALNKFVGKVCSDCTEMVCPPMEWDISGHQRDCKRRADALATDAGEEFLRKFEAMRKFVAEFDDWWLPMDGNEPQRRERVRLARVAIEEARKP